MPDGSSILGTMKPESPNDDFEHEFPDALPPEIHRALSRLRDDCPAAIEPATDAAIFIWKKEPRGKADTRWAMVKDLDRCFAEGVRAHFIGLTVPVPAVQFGKGKPRLATSATADWRSRMQRAGTRLKELYGDKLGYGIKTGLNEAFIISAETRRELRAQSKVDDIIKPVVFGDDIRRYEIQFREHYLIYAYHGIDMARYKAVLDYLDDFRQLPPRADGKPRGLEHRATKQEWWELQQPQRAYEHLFAGPKILYPDIGKEPRFVFDASGYYPETTGFVVGVADSFLLAVLNSSSAWTFFKHECIALGDRDEGGRLRLKTQYVENLTIPDVSDAERAAVGELAERAQTLHGQRRTRVEQFLRDLGVDPAASNSRNPLEQPWSLPPAEFAKRAKPLQRVARERPQFLYEAARDETAALTEQIAKLEAEIDNRVATLYGLDAEDQRWAAKAAPAARPDDRSALFFPILGGLKERSPYFSYNAIQVAANAAELGLKDSSLKVYLTKAVQQGLIHDAGRGWYSRLSESVKLDPKPVEPVVKLLTKRFPLLDEFHCWNTVQVNPWMHHLIAKGVTFVNTDADTMEAVWECLREAGYDAHLNPTGKAKEQFSVRDKTVVVRRRVSGAPVDGHFSRPETVLVDLLLEADRLRLMDVSEFRQMAEAVVSKGRISVPELMNYAENRKQKLESLFSDSAINQRHLFEKGDDN